MNRLLPLSFLPEIGSAERPSTATHVSAGVYSPMSGDNPCAVFTPLHYEPNYAYPLLVWLHSPGNDETQLMRIMPSISLRNYAGVALRGTKDVPNTSGKPGYAWLQSRSHVALAEQRVFDAIEHVQKRINVAQRRIFVAGFGCGGTMAFRLAMSHPQTFAGVLSIGGAFPSERTPLMRYNDARRIPVFMACGRDSQKYPTESVCQDLKLLYAAGMQVALRQYPCAQELSPLMLSDMDRWIMEQITTATPSAPQSAQ